MKTFVRFECGMEDRMTEDLGPFLWVQHTYDVLRVATDADTNGDTEIAEFRDGWWEYNGQRYSDIVIWG